MGGWMGVRVFLGVFGEGRVGDEWGCEFWGIVVSFYVLSNFSYLFVKNPE